MMAAGKPIIDTHIHLFDPARPQGVPWPEKTNQVLYKPAMPDRYRSIAAPLGITGAIVVEASPWLEDNQWVLDVAAKNPIVVGVVGNLEPGKPEFGKQLERFHRNSLFRGIRYGNLWDRNLAAEIAKPQFIADLKLLSKAGLSLDTANPNPELLGAGASRHGSGSGSARDHRPSAADEGEGPWPRSGRAGKTTEGICKTVGGFSAHRWTGSEGSQGLSRNTGYALCNIRRRSRAVWERLAE